jgi:hypothetical protein
MTEEEIRERVDRYSRFKSRGRLRIHEDTTQFMSIDAGDVLDLEGGYYLVRGDETEPRFGLEGDPKYWVKKAVDLSDGSSKIIKLVFHESFNIHVGEQLVKCFRSPQKEGRILEKVKADPYFMQGITVHDTANNTIRIIDRIQGINFYDYICGIKADHQMYLQERFCGILRSIIGCFWAMERLHGMGELHGDIRTDHIFVEQDTGLYRWIDFDYTYEWSENPFGMDLLALGNILLYAFGKGFYHTKDLAARGSEGRAVLSSLTHDDLSLFSGHRVVNLEKIFPYIPECLNFVLLHFAQGAEITYESMLELIGDLEMCMRELYPAEAQSMGLFDEAK